MNNLYNLIMLLIEKPELYLGRRSIQRMYAYIGGYLHQNDAVNDHCLDGFNDYIATQFGASSDHNWADIIQFFSSEERREIELFEKYFREFIANKENKQQIE